MSGLMRSCLLMLAITFVPAALAESHLMRMADVHDDQIVFTYEGDLWLVASAGGAAHRLTNDPGSEVWAKFSPDGSLIAFTAQYDGGLDVYVMAAGGGAPTRLTYHPAMDRVIGWWPDGKSILFRSNRLWPSRGEEVYRVSLAGGLPVQLPVDRAGLASVSPDGKSIAYNRGSRESRTWKRHRGGTAQDIWMGSFDKLDYRKIIDSDWSDNYPMWQADAIYFNSDREDGTLNLYKYDVNSSQITRLTNYRDYDVKYPSIGPNHIIYQYAETLHLLDLNSGQTRQVAVEIPSDLPRMRPEFVSISPSSGSFRLSPSGVRVLLEARGEIINLPAEDGEPINLTNTPGSREKNAAWSPDGRWIAFISDKTGEEEIYLVNQKGSVGVPPADKGSVGVPPAKRWKQLTTGGLGFRMHLEWSPDSKHLVFSDKFMRLNVVDAETGEITVADTADYDDAWERWGIQDYVWSPDSEWIAYTKMEQSMHDSIFLYSMKEQKSYRLTSDMTEDWSPSFDPEGRYLYFLSNRTFSPIMGFADQNHIFLDMTKPYIMLLKADAEPPFRPEDSEEEVADEAAEDEEEEAAEDEAGEEEEESAEEAEEDEPAIDLDGIERRIVAAKDVAGAKLFRLEATKKGFLYLKKPENEFSKYQVVTDETSGSLDLYHYDVGEGEATKVLGGIANYHLSADHKKLVYRAGSTYGVVDAGSKASVGDGKVDYSGVHVEVDRPAEFLQIFNEAWRVQRDWFYDPGLHGLDWPAIGAKYRQFVPFCANRSDLNYLIGEMIAELNIGHTYVGGGDVADNAKSVSTGLLGVDFAADAGAKYYRMAHIVPNTPGDESERSPLDEPGCPIKEDNYLIAIDGVEVTTADNMYQLLQNKSRRIVTLTYNEQPTPEGAQTYRLRTIGSERGIRYREWVEANLAYVNEKSNGQLGYVHIPDMGAGGLCEFARYFYPQYYKKGLIIDVRYNGGGFTGDMILDRLERKIWGMTQPREGKVWRDPERIFAGPWCVLINEDTGSNGEMFAEAVKIKQMAPVIGMRTWGGSIGIEPHQPLVDGGGVTPPQFGLYGLDSKWLIEGIGVIPDIEVQNMPGDVVRGRDAQLDAGIENVSGRFNEAPVLPPAPKYPNKSRPHGS
ncbi:MAG: S41 family peptidase [Planctomycetota bacterium]